MLQNLITKGKTIKAQKVVVYGPEGIGKSTFAAGFPNPLFIDTEGSTHHMDVARLPKPKSWQELLQYVDLIKKEPTICDTLVIDTIDWAESMCVDHVCALKKKGGIEEFGYGAGYVYVQEEITRLLHRLDDVIELGINVVLTAHAHMRKFEEPNEQGAYDRFELKLTNKSSAKTAARVKEWADMVLFANYKVFVFKQDDYSNKAKAQGGKRVMYTAHHPNWDAKNRVGLPEELPFEYASIAHCIPGRSAIHRKVESIQPEEPIKKPVNPDSQSYEAIMPDYIEKLKNLMALHQVSDEDIKRVVAKKGYYTATTPIETYEKEFIEGCLIAAWEQVYQQILETKAPF